MDCGGVDDCFFFRVFVGENRSLLGEAEFAVTVKINVLTIVLVVVNANTKQIFVECKSTLGSGCFHRSVNECDQREERNKNKQRFETPEQN